MRALAVALLLCATFAPAAKLPRVVIVDKRPWAIELRDKVYSMGVEVYGVTICAKHVIQLDKSMSDWDRAETLLHELMHAMVCQGAEPQNSLWNNDDETGEHAGIYMGASKLLALMRYNPDLWKFIQSCDPPAPTDDPLTRMLLERDLKKLRR